MKKLRFLNRDSISLKEIKTKTVLGLLISKVIQYSFLGVLFNLFFLFSLSASPYILNMPTAEIENDFGDNLGGGLSLIRFELHYKTFVMLDTMPIADALLFVNGGLRIGYQFDKISVACGFRYFNFLGESTVKNILQNKIDEKAAEEGSESPTINDVKLQVLNYKIIPSVSYKASDKLKGHLSFIYSNKDDGSVYQIYTGCEWNFYSNFHLLGEFYFALNKKTTSDKDSYLYNLISDNFGGGIGVKYRKGHFGAVLGFTYPGFDIKINSEDEVKLLVLPFVNIGYYF